jgi:hypothetical protein
VKKMARGYSSTISLHSSVIVATASVPTAMLDEVLTDVPPAVRQQVTEDDAGGGGLCAAVLKLADPLSSM